MLFAGATVVIALLGLYTLNLGSLEGVALSVTLTVLMTMLASLTLLPSLLTIFGTPAREADPQARRQDRSGEPGRRWRSLGRPRPARVPGPPWSCAVAALGALCVPALSMQLGLADAGNDHPSTTSRQAYDLIAEGFGPGANGPLVVVTQGDQATAAGRLRDACPGPTGVVEATPPQASPDGALFTSLAFPDDLAPGPRRPATWCTDCATTCPTAYLVGGPTAAVVDFSDAVGDRFPLFIGVVVGLSALLLLLVFRSVAIAIKAAVLNLLSIGACLGVITLIFHDGWFGAQPGPVEAFVPVMIFAIVFGLSMDYEVFLVSRMHEEWEAHRGPGGRGPGGAGEDRRGDHRGRGDHDRGLRLLRARSGPDAAAVRRRPGLGGAARRAGDPLPGRARRAPAARHEGLVGAALAAAGEGGVACCATSALKWARRGSDARIDTGPVLRASVTPAPGGVPEWPIGTALKAVAGSNVSRGFESRPLCVIR